MIITISGKPGSGKSTIGKRLAEALGYERHYMGGLRRKMAAERGMTLAEFNKLGESEEFTDRDVDEEAARLGATTDNFVIEGRTMFKFIPHGIHIFLDVEPEEGARRILQHLKEDTDNSRNEDKDLNTVEDVLRSTHERMKSDQLRYEKYYNLDVFDPKHYDLVVDTTHLAPDQVFAKIISFLDEKKDKSVAENKGKTS
ncbi:MAG: cytidylate kinase family protein [Patescibacteria group bacterium]|jgi:cytidylate kinase